MKKILSILLIGGTLIANAAELPNPTDLKKNIQEMLIKKQSLKNFYDVLSQKYGHQVVSPLIQLALSEQEPDEIRWICLFSLARLTGKESLGIVQKFLTHESWMLRDAALKVISRLKANDLKQEVGARLKDKALIVRTTAVETIENLQLKEFSPQLVEALFDPINYNRGYPLWIHKHILKTLENFQYKEAVPRLVELLQIKKDPALQARLIQTLENLTGKSFAKKSIHEQIYIWRRIALSEKEF